jgi:peptidyl-prolyl cis-trans isomerase C
MTDVTRSLKRATIAALAAASFVLAAPPLAAKVLAKVDGVEITDEDVQIAVDDLGATLPKDLQGPARDTYIVDYLTDLKIVARQADKDKLGEGSDFARRSAYFRDKLLMETLLGKETKAAMTDAAMKKVYDDAAARQKPEEEIHARHILLPTEDEAKAALKRVQDGEDFTKVATELSKDPGSQGGDLGFFSRDKMVPEFADVAFKLDVGKLSEPVKSQFGWHIIKVEEKRTKPFPPFEAVKDQIAQYVARKSQSDLILKLREGVKIERSDQPPAQVPDASPKDAPKQ